MSLKEELEIKYSLKYLYDFTKVRTNDLTKEIKYTCLEHDTQVITTGEKALKDWIICPDCLSDYRVSHSSTVKDLTDKHPNVLFTYDKTLTLIAECRECGNKLNLQNNTVPKCRICSKANYSDRKAAMLSKVSTVSYPNLSVVTCKVATRKVLFNCNLHGNSSSNLNTWLTTLTTPCKLCRDEISTKPLKHYVDRYKDTVWTPIKIEPPLLVLNCLNHGEFAVSLEFKGKIPCRKCNTHSKRISVPFEVWRQRSQDKHGTKYDYSKVTYLGTQRPVKLICNLHQHEFWYSAGNHLITPSGGCPKCQFGTCGFSQDRPATLYYIKVSNKAYKIGITNTSVSRRFTKKELENIEVIKEWHYEIGADALKEEQQILEKYKAFKYTGTPLLLTGNTELFTKDILNLNKHKDKTCHQSQK